jgi:hypothetical protein
MKHNGTLPSAMFLLPDATVSLNKTLKNGPALNSTHLEKLEIVGEHTYCTVLYSTLGFHPN